VYFRRERIFCAWLSMAGAVLFWSDSSANAQVSGNIQTQANILSPPITTILPEPVGPSRTNLPAAAQRVLDEISYPKKLCPPTELQISEVLAELTPYVFRGHGARVFSQDPKFANDVVRNVGQLSLAMKQSVVKRLSVLPINFQYCNGQPTTIKASLQFNPTYETNALKSGQNSSSDGSFGINESVLVTTGVGETRPYDLIFFNSQAASSRHDIYTSKSLDTWTAQAGYQYLIDGYFYNHGDSVAIDKSHIPSNGAVTFDTVTFSVVNQDLFTPTFHSSSADLVTPQISLARQDIDLGASTDTCPGGSNPPPPPSNPNRKMSPSVNFCYYADLAFTVGQTFSDVATLQNANLAASVTVGERFRGTDWTLAGQVIVTPRYFENVPGGREDIMIQGGPVLTYAHAPMRLLEGTDMTQSISFSLPVNYYQNYSTVSKYSWGGLIVQPTLTIAFVPPPK